MSISTKLKAIALGSTLLVSSYAFGEDNKSKKEESSGVKLHFSNDYFSKDRKTEFFPSFCACSDTKTQDGGEKTNFNYGFRGYLTKKYIDTFLTIQMNNKQKVSTDDNSTTTESTKTGAIGVFVPLNYFDTTLAGKLLHTKLGIIAEVDTVLSGESLQGTKSYYYGARWAMRPTTYIDVMHGKTENADERLKIRGEYQFDMKMILGMEYNTQIENTDNVTSKSKDNFRIYFKFPLDVSKILGE
jgi:hypothetical protein